MDKTPLETSIQQPLVTPENVGDKSGGEEHCQRTGGQQAQQPKSGKEE